jgi:hypothetical protein
MAIAGATGATLALARRRRKCRCNPRVAPPKQAISAARADRPLTQGQKCQKLEFLTLAEVAEWQTRWTQNTECGASFLLRSQRFAMT